MTVAGHGQNVHVIGNHDYASASDSSPGAALDGSAYEAPDMTAGPEGASSTVPGRRKERKHRYLDSLMDKAGELNLRCESAGPIERDVMQAPCGCRIDAVACDPSEPGEALITNRLCARCGWGMDVAGRPVQEGRAV